MQNLINDLMNALKNDERLIIDGKLVKNKIVELALSMDEGLIKLLLANNAIKKHFFKDIGGVLVFDKIAFQSFVSNKQFLPDSYTAFKNKIGLTANSEYLTESKEVVLAWPYKDCVLEGGQTKEDQKRKEIFWNETLAPDEIDRLLAPKALTNFKKYDKDGEHEVDNISLDDNLIIKGNNLLALHTLKKKFIKNIKLIYIDPPYNTGSDGFGYNDSFNHSAWLTFMKNRLEIARDLLSNDGSIWITLDENEIHYFKIICDDVFGRDNFISTVIWKISDNSNNNATRFSEDHNQILVYGKNKDWKPKFLNYESKRSHFKNPDNDPKGKWFDGNPVNNPGLRPNLQFKLKTPNGNIINHPPNGWRWSKDNIDKKLQSGELRFNKEQTRLIRRTYLADMEGLPPTSLWIDLKETGHNRQAKYELKKLFPELPVTDLFSTPKPERLIKKIIELSTNKNDIVLDFFAGSGTTAAVTKKMKRKFIAIEQMDYIDKFLVARLNKVILGDNVGVSDELNWNGGGSFLYCELFQYSSIIVNKILKSNTHKALYLIWKNLENKNFISYKVKPESINKNINKFEALSLEEQKQFLIAVIDKNQLYVNYSDIDDEDYKISEDDKKLNKQFYGDK